MSRVIVWYHGNWKRVICALTWHRAQMLFPPQYDCKRCGAIGIPQEIARG